jgi:hypothetical protein
MDLGELEALASDIVNWAGHLAAGTASWLAMIARFDEAEGWARWECGSCAQWLNWQCGLEVRAAREHVRVARRLEALPVLREAFGRGEVSYSKVRALTRVAEPETEADMLMLAQHSTAAQLERIVAACVRVGRSISDEEASARHDARRLALGWDDDGSMTVSGRLPPELGAVLVKALAHAESTLPADARQEDAAARRADALATVAAAYLDGACNAAAQERYQVLVHVDADTLALAGGGPHTDHTPGAGAGRSGTASDAARRQADGRTGATGPPGAAWGPDGGATGPPGAASDPDGGDERLDAAAVPAAPAPARQPPRCHVDDGPSLCLETIRRLTCDATFVPLVEGPDGEPLGIGRRSRRVPPRLRRFLAARDEGCRFPGCGHRRFQAHHVQHWTAGGPTDPDNLISLCSFHHHRLHEGGWSAIRQADGPIVFRDRFGLVLAHTGSTGGSAEPLRSLPVRPGAMTCRWTGEQADLDHITTSLYNRPSRSPDDPHDEPDGQLSG